MLARRYCAIFVRHLSGKQLVYAEYGDPAKFGVRACQVLKLQTIDLPDTPPSGHVHVRWIAAPINPADLNTLQGVYPIKPPLPAVAGNEGYGRVEKVNPPTAYRMLKDFVSLKPGDTVIQNGANSAVGKAAIQICRLRGIRSINVVRKRDDMAPLVNELRSLGANEVITEDQLLKEYRGKIKDVRLALNCVGGKSALLLASTLGFRGCMVTYGGMSKQPLQVFFVETRQIEDRRLNDRNHNYKLTRAKLKIRVNQSMNAGHSYLIKQN
ncbi:GroES-like protein [Ancylostoma duodenale]|uniref:Enoyl-[acyl-carrier-protein] reductase, mitochondrial n=1 Tax=Ancylostoma duodenale TaxID=51022 RepID=A0A0C2G2Q5_9BILA|nr:GroES-like protein [Ancylostoma duodenale]